MTKKVETGSPFKMPSALSHGAYSSMAILRGENPEQYNRLFMGLVDEYMPEGTTELEAVMSLANMYWRKWRIQKAVSAQIIRWRMDPNHPIYDKSLDPLHAKAQCERLKKLLEDSAKCSEAGSKEQKMELDALIEEFGATMSNDHVLYPTAIAEQAYVLECDLFKKELDQLERIEASIDRLIKRIYQIKGMKQALFSPVLNNHVSKLPQTSKSVPAAH
jgi:hypothetical protein